MLWHGKETVSERTEPRKCEAHKEDDTVVLGGGAVRGGESSVSKESGNRDRDESLRTREKSQRRASKGDMNRQLTNRVDVEISGVTTAKSILHGGLLGAVEEVRNTVRLVS